MAAIMIAGLAAFCLVFAVNSSVHSYLIVKYADGDKVAMNIGFYYMANAMGRLTGTLVSGALYSFVGPTLLDGFAACFWASAGFAVTSAFVDFFLNDGHQGLKLGPCLTVVPPHAGHNALGYVNEGSGALQAHDTPRKPSSAAQSFPDGNKPWQGEQAAPSATAPEVVVVMEGPHGSRGKGVGDAVASPASGQDVGVAAGNVALHGTC